MAILQISILVEETLPVYSMSYFPQEVELTHSEFERDPMFLAAMVASAKKVAEEICLDELYHLTFKRSKAYFIPVNEQFSLFIQTTSDVNEHEIQNFLEDLEGILNTIESHAEVKDGSSMLLPFKISNKDDARITKLLEHFNTKRDITTLRSCYKSIIELYSNYSVLKNSLSTLPRHLQTPARIIINHLTKRRPIKEILNRISLSQAELTAIVSWGIANRFLIQVSLDEVPLYLKTESGITN